MAAQRIGFDVEDLRCPVKEALDWIAEQGRTRLELPTSSGETAPRNLSASGRKHLIRYVEGLGLGIASLTADYPGLRLTNPDSVDERVERTCEALELARELRVPVVTAAVGALTHPESGELSEIAEAALRGIGEFADSRGVVFALRPTQDSADRIDRVLSKLDCPSFRLGLDPAAMVMHGENPIALLERHGSQIALIHARDATAGFADRPGHETEFGGGEVDYVGVTKLLMDFDFHGPILARSADAFAPRKQLLQASTLLEKLLRS